MVDINEIRHGNYYLLNDGSLHKYSITSYLQIRPENLHPIELTDEVLSKTDLTTFNGKKRHLNYLFSFNENGLAAKFLPEERGDVCKPFKYLHQLQNFINSITGVNITYTP